MKRILKLTFTISTVIIIFNILMFSLPNQSLSEENDREIEKLIGFITSDNEKISEDAKKKLIELGEYIVPFLVAKLNNENFKGKPEIVNLLGELGPQSAKAVPSLISILGNEIQNGNSSWFLVANSALTLGEIGPDARAAIPSLIKTMKTDGSNWVGDWDSGAKITAIDVIRGNSIYALGRIGVEAIPSLIKELDSIKGLGQTKMRKNAASALYFMKKPVIPELINFLKNPNLGDETKSWIFAVLGWFGPKAQGSVGSVIEMLDHSTAEMLPDLIGSLEKISGKNFGKDKKKWKTWWKEKRTHN